jgi:hypothetical protein
MQLCDARGVPVVQGRRGSKEWKWVHLLLQVSSLLLVCVCRCPGCIQLLLLLSSSRLQGRHLRRSCRQLLHLLRAHDLVLAVCTWVGANSRLSPLGARTADRPAADGWGAHTESENTATTNQHPGTQWSVDSSRKSIVAQPQSLSRGTRYATHAVTREYPRRTVTSTRFMITSSRITSRRKRGHFG